MKSLFIKIFLAFWLAMTLIAAIGIILALTIDTGAETHDQRQRRYSSDSKTLIEAYRTGEPEAYLRQLAALNKKRAYPAYLFDRNLEAVDGSPLPAEIVALARLARETRATQVHSGVTFIWVAYPAEDGFVYLAKKTRPSQLQRLLGWHDLGIRLGVTFLVAGIICYGLARSLTSDIGRLRSAARTLANGDLKVRVSDQVGGNDEIAALARDFDLMAAWIENLVTSQHRLLQDVSHELRSPLTRLSLAVDLLEQTAPEGHPDLLRRIEKESFRLNSLIGQILTLARLENSIGIATKTPVDLAALLAEIAEDGHFEARPQNKHVALTASGNPVISGDSELLRQALENVVRNAVYSTAEQTGVEITLGIEGKKDLCRAVIEVRDHGPGVDESEVGNLFLPFYRANTAREKPGGGYGLGLAITERAISLHQGRITASNHPDGGLLVRMELPLAAGRLEEPNDGMARRVPPSSTLPRAAGQPR